ncbi:MAG: DUF1178 family protein [Pseudomonadota bacterium]
MIRYDLVCMDCQAEFDAWFASSSAFDEQCDAGLVSCAVCDGAKVAKQIMAPAVRSSKVVAKNKGDLAKAIEAARTFIDETHDYVGTEFADEARAMHYGEVETRPIWGEVTSEESGELKEEGVAAAPLPPPLVPRKRRNGSKSH